MPVSTVNTRIVGVFALTAALLLHGTQLKLGLRIQNILGAFILLVMLFIALTGVLVLIFPQLIPTGRTDNLLWSNLWTDSRFEANAFVTALYNVIWCLLFTDIHRIKVLIIFITPRSFVGYSNANYALSEVKNPVQTIKRAAPLAMLSITIVYILVNIAYFAVVSKDDILDSGRVVASVIFR